MKKEYMFAIISALMLACVCGGCAGAASEHDADAQAKALPAQSATAESKIEHSAKDKLAETVWYPVFLIDREDSPMPPATGDEAVRLHINKDMRVNGYSGDNLFGGELTVLDSGFFKIGKMYSTRRAGPYGEYEYKFLNALGKANRFEFKGDNLKLFDGSTLLLEFKKGTK